MNQRLRAAGGVSQTPSADLAAVATGRKAARWSAAAHSRLRLSYKARHTQAGSTGASPGLSLGAPNVLGAPDLLVRALDAAHTAHTLSPNLSAERIGVHPPRVGHDPPCGFLTARSILRRLDWWLPLGVSSGW